MEDSLGSLHWKSLSVPALPGVVSCPLVPKCWTVGIARRDGKRVPSCPPVGAYTGILLAAGGPSVAAAAAAATAVPAPTRDPCLGPSPGPPRPRFPRPHPGPENPGESLVLPLGVRKRQSVAFAKRQALLPGAPWGFGGSFVLVTRNVSLQPFFSPLGPPKGAGLG